MSGLPAVPVMTSGYIHASAKKALSMLGIGHEVVRVLSSDPVGRIDLTALEGALIALKGEPAIVIATAGEVNAGGFDPIAAMVDLAHRHHAWLHVDGAFGLFARVSRGRRDHQIREWHRRFSAGELHRLRLLHLRLSFRHSKVQREDQEGLQVHTLL